MHTFGARNINNSAFFASGAGDFSAAFDFPVKS